MNHPLHSRRTVLLGTAGALALSATGGVAAHARPRHPQPTGGSVRRATAFLGTMLEAYPEANGDGPRLAQSYADELGLFSTAFVYDNALAILAALGAGRLDLARAMGDGLVFAQENDPAFDDGRLRQAYNVGPYTFYDGSAQPDGLVRADGTANVGSQFGFLGTAVGDMAWPGIALVRLWRRTRDRRHLRGALRIAEWITTRATNPGALGGFSFGVTAADVRVPNVSTEHNIDCVSFFGQLAEATGDRRWLVEAERAERFLERVWQPVGGYFFTGSNDGDTINRTPLPLDPQTWSWLTLRSGRYARSVDWAAEALATTDDARQATSQLPDGVRISGVTFSSASLTSTAVYNDQQVHPNGVWLEGTAQLACAYGDRARGGADARRRTALMVELERAQRLLGTGQRVGGTPLPAASGVVAASSVLDSGFGFGYFPVQHVGATAWYVMAGERYNPMSVPGRR